MTGFAAAFAARPRPDLAALVAAMSAGIEHRGDLVVTGGDGESEAIVTRNFERGVYRASALAAADSTVIFDGFLFNERQLRARLGGASICETVARGFRELGTALFDELDGSFAVAVHDRAAGVVHLARDKYGHRPLLVGITAETVLLASETRPLFADPALRRRINEEMLVGAISSGLVLGPETLLHDVYKVLPAFACEVRQGSFIVGDPYYQPRATVDTSTTLSDVEDFVAASLRRSIEAYCSGAARVGVFLSGGIDSALLGTELARIEENDGRGVSFGASNWVDEESTAAARVARKLGLPFTQAQVDGSFDALAGLEQAIWHIGEPTMFENAIALEVAAHAVAGDAGALLTGEGGDDFFGAQNLIIARWLPAAWKLPAGLRHGLASALSSAPLDPLSRVGRYLGSDSLEHYLRGAQSWAPGLVARAPDRGVQDRVARLEEDYRGLSSVGSLTVLLLIGYWYPWIERMEQTSAAHGIDALHPFQRDELLQFSLTVPDNLKMRRGGLVLKPALRNLVEQRLGTEEVRGAKKQLAAPFALWLRSSRTLRQAVLDLRRPSARFREFLDPALAAPYLDDFARNGPKDTATRRGVSMLLSFEIWLGQVLDGERPPASFDP